MAQVKVDLPGSDPDVEVEVLYLGIFFNGGTTEVTDEQVATWEALSNRSWPEDGVLVVPTPADVPDVVYNVDETTEAVTVEPVAKTRAKGGDK